MNWFPERMWEGARVAVIGGGHSLTSEQVRIVRQAGYRTVGVNHAYKLGVNIDICFWGDKDWFYGVDGNPGQSEGVLAWPGLRVTISPECAHESAVCYLIAWNTPGLQPLPRLRWYRSSGLSAIALAAQLGASRIMLLGFDGYAANGQTNWHADNIHPPDDRVFNAHKECARELVRDLAEFPDTKRVQIWNASPGTAYDAFPTTTVEQGV